MGWVTEVKAIPQAAPQRHTVVISAGHSLTDPGAVAHGYRESRVVTEFRNLVSAALAEQGIRHLTDGEGEDNWPLSKAAKLAAGASIAVEFHCDAASPSAGGTWTLSRDDQLPLAVALCHATADTLGIRNRGAHPEDAGQHHRLAFVSDGGGIVHELFFLTSKQDLAAYIAGKRGLANEVARVIADAARAE